MSVELQLDRHYAHLSVRIGSKRNLAAVVGQSGDVMAGKACLLEGHRREDWCRREWLYVEYERGRRTDMKRDPLEYTLLRRQKTAHARDTNCDIFSWASSQFAVWAWNMAAIAAASSSGVSAGPVRGT